jgi:mono/diheme cytochrome c family protein
MLKKFTAFFGFMIIMSSCGQNYNSNYNDLGQYTAAAIDRSTVAGARFAAAYSILQVKCMGCHAWASYDSSEKWIQSGYVIQGNFSGSNIITHLKNFGGNMPKDPASALPDSEIADLLAWITNL